MTSETEPTETESSATPSSAPPSTLRSLWFAPVVVVSIALGVGIALRPEWGASAGMWGILCIPYGVLAIWALVEMKRNGVLGERLRMKYGDASVGILLGLVLVAAGFATTRAVAPPGSAAEAWMFRIYLFAGDLQKDSGLIGMLVLLAILEELVWRGLVLDRLMQPMPRLGPPLSAGLAALANLPSLWLLADPNGGLNPLLILAALGCGLVWAYARVVLRRLPPIMISHVIFTYFMAAPFPKWLLW